MKVTRVSFTKVNSKVGTNYMATCEVVLDDSIMLSGISLYSNNESGFYLVFPSKQDVYKLVSNLNKDTFIKYPQNLRNDGSSTKSKMYEEFYHPVKKEFYEELLDTIVKSYKNYISDSDNVLSLSYSPN